MDNNDHQDIHICIIHGKLSQRSYLFLKVTLYGVQRQYGRGRNVYDIYILEKNVIYLFISSSTRIYVIMLYLGSY